MVGVLIRLMYNYVNYLREERWRAYLNIIWGFRGTNPPGDLEFVHYSSHKADNEFMELL